MTYQPCQQQNEYLHSGYTHFHHHNHNSQHYYPTQMQRPRFTPKQQQMARAKTRKWPIPVVDDREYKDMDEEQHVQHTQSEHVNATINELSQHNQSAPRHRDQPQRPTPSHSQSPSQSQPQPPPATYALTQQPNQCNHSHSIANESANANGKAANSNSNSNNAEAQHMIEGECFVSIDVECAATGHGHFDLLPCRIAMVDFYGNVLFDRVCSPLAVVDPLTEFTGLTAWQIKRAPPLAAVLSEFHELLSWLNNQYRHGVTVIGQSVVMDLVWARLVPNTHYRRSIDIAQLFRTQNSNFEYKKWQYYSLRQAAWALLGVSMNEKFHDPTEDARITIQLYRDCCLSPSVLHSAKQRLQNFKASCSFPDFRVVTKFKQCSAMYNPSRCRCGQKTAVGIEGVEDLEKLRALYMEHMNKVVLYEQYT